MEQPTRKNMLEFYYIEDLKQGDIVIYSEHNHMGFVEEIDTNLDDNDEEYLHAIIRWFDGHKNTLWDNSDISDGVRVIRS
jgi:hypothetical protein